MYGLLFMLLFAIWIIIVVVLYGMDRAGVVFLQRWEKTKVGKQIGAYRYWSDPVTGEGDPGVRSYGTGFFQWIGKVLFWNKLIVLVPKGDPGTHFKIVFHSSDGLCMFSSAVRQIKDGPFKMRMGPENCDFFIVGGEGEVQLEIAGYDNYRTMKTY